MLIQNYQIKFYKIIRILLLVTLMSFAANSWADDVSSTTSVVANTANSSSTTPVPTAPTTNNAPTGVALGAVANNLLEPVEIASSFLSGISFILGVTSLFSAFLRYKHHRNNPLAYPISTIVLLFFLGSVLLLLPLTYKLTESGVPFSL